MGSNFSLILVASDSAMASKIAVNCFALVDSFAQIYSDYDVNSELSKLSSQAGNGPQEPSPALWDMLVQSDYAYKNSQKSFDISVGPLSWIWRKSRKEKIFPDPKQIDSVLLFVGLNKMLLDTINRTATLLQKGMRLDLGGIAKGYIAQQVVNYLKKEGISSSLVDAGGDLAMGDAPPDTEGWTVGVNIPETTDDLIRSRLLLNNMAVATSGDVYRYVEHDGKKYSHIVDPRTGYGVTFQRNVTVIAKDGTTADWLATACSILSVRDAKKIARKQNAYLFISTIENGKIKTYTSRGFDQFWKK